MTSSLVLLVIQRAQGKISSKCSESKSEVTTGPLSPKGKFLNKKLTGGTVTSRQKLLSSKADFGNCDVISFYHFWIRPLSNQGSQLLRIKWCLFPWQKAQWPTQAINGSHCAENIAIEIGKMLMELISLSVLIVTKLFFFLKKKRMRAFYFTYGTRIFLMKIKVQNFKTFWNLYHHLFNQIIYGG